MKHSLATRVLALVLVVSLQALFVPAKAAEEAASLGGMVVSSETDAPLVGVRLHAGDPKTGRIYSARPTSEDGGFRLGKLPPASYQLAVETEGGLYVVESPLKLSPGQIRDVTVAINPESAPSPAEEEEEKKKKGVGFWNNPVTASAAVIGSATLLGLLLKEGTDDPVVSPVSN